MMNAHTTKLAEAMTGWLAAEDHDEAADAALVAALVEAGHMEQGVEVFFDANTREHGVAGGQLVEEERWFHVEQDGTVLWF